MHSIRGTVTSEADGAPVGGVMVLVEGTNSYATTNAVGEYTISASQGDVLVFSLLGFASQSVSVGAGTVIDVVLATDAEWIDDLVVIGYGTQQKKLVTGATVQVSGDDIAKLNTVNALSALQSQTPGVNITQGSGQPGTQYGFKVHIRGMGTKDNAAPLYVIDGIPAGNSNGALSNINPADIQSIDVLKDAASAAIYGSRAANGVILVTTKQGRAGQRAQVSLDGYYGFQNVYKLAQTLNAQQYADIMNEANIMDGLAPFDFASMVPNWDRIADGSWKGTNWLEESRNKNAPIQNYTLNITGGTEQSVYSIGLGYTSQEGIFGAPVASKYERYTARLNTEHVLFKGRDRDIIKFGENLTYTFNQNQGRMSMDNQYSNDIANLMRTTPFLPMYDEDGEYHKAIDWDLRQVNPIAQNVYSTNSRDNSIDRDHSLRSSLYLIVEPIKNLVLKSTFGYAYGAGSRRNYTPKMNLGPQSVRDVDSVQQEMNNSQSITWENTATYKFDINGNHNFTALIGNTIEKWGGSMGDRLRVSNENPRFHDLEHAYIDNANLASAATTISGGPQSGMGRLASFFGRVSYDYKNKYMLTAVVRADGSHNFARGHRWGTFPSVSAGWVMTEEPWMENARNWMNFLKIRASWGQNGNQDVSSFQYYSSISTGGRYVFGDDKSNPSMASYPSNFPNAEISWETSEQIDLGFDASFFRSRLNVAFDYYVKNTKDWLVDAPQLTSYGATNTTYINGGDIRNSGVELGLSWDDKAGEFSYGANVNFAYNKNEVTRIASDRGFIEGPADVLYRPHDGAYRIEVGRPIGFFYGYKTAGVFQTQEQIDNYPGAKIKGDYAPRPGDMIWVDHDKDGEITDADRTMIGDPNPDVTLGIGLNFGWKGFDLNIAMHGVFGNQILRTWRSWPDGPKGNYVASEAFDRWHGVGTSNTAPRLSASSHPNRQWISDLYIEDGDYLRMQNITLGYDFKYLLPKANWLSQVRVYVTAQNLFTITGYSGMDPEIGWGDGGEWASGVDVGFYPSPRTWIVGVNLKF